MSVTFTVSRAPVGFRLGCAFSPTVHPTFEQAATALAEHGDGLCAAAAAWLEANTDDHDAPSRFLDEHGRFPDDCAMFVLIEPVHDEDVPELNVSNDNARLLLEALGYDPEDLYGTVDATDLLGRVLIADGLSPEDPGRPTVTERGTGGATIVSCGRKVGYLQDRLGQLRELASWAAERNLPVTWS